MDTDTELEFLGQVYLQRAASVAPVRTLDVSRRPNGFLYFSYTVGDGIPMQFMMTSPDRKQSTLIIEDDTPERQEALKQALLNDRWTRVVIRP